MSDVGTVSFYRDEAARISRIAGEVKDRQARLELMQIAAKFMKLAEFAEASTIGNSAHRSSGARQA